MKSIKSLTVFYFLLSSVSGASATVTATENWGDLIDDVARLTWAENNCNGQVPDFVRELRIYIRRQAGAALHEAELRVNNDIRLTINSGAGSIGKEDAIRWYCVGLNRLYGERGRMPGFWLADGAWVGTAAPKGNTRLARYGEIVRILATLEEMSGLCNRLLTHLASELARAFMSAGGREEFKRFAYGDLLVRADNNTLTEKCAVLDQRFGQSANWPPLWQGQVAKRADTPIVNFSPGIVREAKDAQSAAPFEIHTEIGVNYFFKLIRLPDRNEQVAGFIVGGSSISTRVPAGSYELRFVSGQVWISEVEYFGRNSSFAKTILPLTFSGPSTN